MALFNDPNNNLTDLDDLPDDGRTYHIEDYVGADKKYKTNADVAKALAYKDAFIEQLKNENKVTRTAQERLQEELKTRQTLQEFLDQMNLQRTTPPAPAKEPINDGETRLTQESIQQLVEQTIASRSAAQREEDNLNTVQQRLIETFGPRYEPELRKRTQELGMTDKEMTSLAMRNPKAFLELVTPSVSKPSLFSSPDNRVNIEALRNTAGDKTWSYYENIRKTDSRKYFTPSMHNEMMKQLELLGDEDFYK